jgi:hypothetical protein
MVHSTSVGGWVFPTLTKRGYPCRFRTPVLGAEIYASATEEKVPAVAAAFTVPCIVLS